MFDNDNPNVNPFYQALLNTLSRSVTAADLANIELLLLSILTDLDAKADLDETQPVLARFTLDGVITTVTEDTVTPSNNTPLPVKITSATGDINITAQDLNVQLSHLGANADSVRIGDGTEILLINADGSINTSSTSPSSIDNIINASVSTSATQVTASDTPCKIAHITSHPDNTGRMTIGGSSVTDKNGIVLYPGETYPISIDNVNAIYVAAEVNGEDIIVTYTV
jgi:hypothetical protein